MNSSVFKGRHHSAVSAYGVASLDIGGRQQVMKNGGGRCCKKNMGTCPIPLSVRFVAETNVNSYDNLSTEMQY
jgi:hypothetical protein